MMVGVDKPLAGTIGVDESRAPILVSTVIGLPSDARFAVYLEELTRAAMRLRRYTLIVDLTRAERATPFQREAQARWVKEHQTMLTRHCAGVVLVITNPLVRGALTAIHWLHRPAHPVHVTKTFAEAEAWVQKRLADSLD